MVTDEGQGPDDLAGVWVPPVDAVPAWDPRAKDAAAATVSSGPGPDGAPIAPGPPPDAAVGGPQQPVFAPPPGIDPDAVVFHAPSGPHHAPKGPSAARVAVFTLTVLLVIGAAIGGALVVSGANHRATKPHHATLGATTTSAPPTTTRGATTVRPVVTAAPVPRVGVTDPPSGIAFSMRAVPDHSQQQFTVPGGGQLSMDSFLADQGSWAESVAVGDRPAATPALEQAIADGGAGAGLNCQVGPATPMTVAGRVVLRASLSGCLRGLNGSMVVFDAGSHVVQALVVSMPFADLKGENLATLVATLRVP